MPILSFRACLAFCFTACYIEAAVFSGFVLDGTTGKPISNALVTVGSKVARTDGAGNFELDGDATSIAARAYGYSCCQITVDPRNGKAVQVKLIPITARALPLVLGNRDTKSSRVSSSPGGKHSRECGGN